MLKRLKADQVAREQARKKCLRKFLYYFRKGYADAKYISWERGYKEAAHGEFQDHLNRKMFEDLLKRQDYKTVAETAVRIESRTNLLFSFEKMALRDAVRSAEGAKSFATGLFEYIYGDNSLGDRFEAFVKVVEKLPRKQTRVLTWPLVTVFGFIGNPKEHMFLKPTVTRVAAGKYDYAFNYQSKPNLDTYLDLLDFANQIKKDTRAYRPRDYIDLQSFIWVLGSEEYPD